MNQTNIPQQGISGVEGGGQVTIYQYFLASPYFAGFGSSQSIERKTFLNTFDQLSTTVRDFLSSDETAYAITTICQNYGLEDDQVAELASTVRELVVGEIFIKDFSTLISSKLGIDDVKAGEITNKLISKSFGPIIEDVKRIQRSKFPEKIMRLQKEGRPEGLTRPPTPRAGSPGPQLDAVQPPQRPVQQAPTPQMSIPPEEQPKKPEFKIPNLGESIAKEGGNNAKRSLEEELEKVASVIDLRGNPKE